MQLVRIKGTGFGVYQRGDGRYIAKIRDRDDVPRSPTYRRAAEANEAVRKAYREWPGRRDTTDISIEAMIGEYLEHRLELARRGPPDGITESTFGIDTAGAKRIIAFWGSQSAGEMDDLGVIRWYRDLRGGDRPLKDSSVANYAKVLRGAYTHAMRTDGPLAHLTQAPVPSVLIRDTKRGEAFTPAEMQAILTEAPRRYRGMFAVLATTGMRIEEICLLDVPDFDPVRAVLIGGIKTEAGRDRVITLPSWVAAILIEEVGDRSSGPLFRNARSNRVSQDVFRRRIWHPLMDRLGLTGAVPHWFRHTAATLAGEQGRTLWEVKSHFGWKDARSAGRYIKPHREGVRSIADGLEALAPRPREVNG